MQGTHPQRPPNSTTGVDTALDLADTVLTIVHDVSGVFANFPYVGSVAAVIQQFLTIRNEIKASETRCHQIIDKVIRRSESICEDLVSIVNSDARERLNKLETRLRDYDRALRAMHDSLKRYQRRSRVKKFFHRGLDDLNDNERQLDNFDTEIILKILVDLRTEQADLASRVDRMAVPEPAYVFPFDNEFFVNNQAAISPLSDSTYHVLPPKPQLMVERESQLDIALEILLRAEPSRLTILGGAGFGKTTLARTILHTPEIIGHYQSRYFLSCEGMPDVETVLLGFGAMLGITSPPSSMLASARRKLETSTTLICFDNFETPWEPSVNRTKVEDLLALIADIPKISLIITMRGTQRPSKVAWSQPLLAPLSTLSFESARLVLRAICPNHTIDHFTELLLDGVEGIPLAITLVSNLLRDGETSRALWTRWSIEQTSIIENGGDDRESNLDASIALSVNSPRMKKDPGAVTLLAALSVLPDGFPLADATQLGAHLNINGVHRFLQMLRAVALIKPEEVNPNPRIQMLSPIRLFCNRFISSEISTVLEMVIDYHINLLSWPAHSIGDLGSYAHVVPEIRNIHSTFQRAYRSGHFQDITRLIDATFNLTAWSHYIGYLAHDTIEMAIEKSANHPDSHAKCLIALGDLNCTEGYYTRAEECFRKAVELFKQIDDSVWEGQGMKKLGDVLRLMHRLDQAEVAFKASLDLYTQAEDALEQASVRFSLGLLYINKAQYSEADKNLTIALEASKKIHNLPFEADIAQSLSLMHINCGNLAKAETLASDALAAGKQASYAVGEANALGQLGHIWLQTDRIAEAKQALEKAVTIFKQQNNRIGELIAINDLAQVYIKSDQLSTAQALLTSSAKVDLDVIQIPRILTTLGWLYICGDRPEDAEPYLDTAAKLFQKFDHKISQAEALAHLATVYLRSNRLDEAMQVLKSIPDQAIPQERKAHRLWVFGNLYIVMGQLEDAGASLSSAMSLYQNSEFTYSYQQGNILRSMGTLLTKGGHINLALQAFKRALEFHRKAQWVSEQAIDFKQLGEAYKMIGRTEDADAAFKEGEALTDTVRETRALL